MSIYKISGQNLCFFVFFDVFDVLEREREGREEGRERVSPCRARMRRPAGRPASRPPSRSLRARDPGNAPPSWMDSATELQPVGEDLRRGSLRSASRILKHRRTGSADTVDNI